MDAVIITRRRHSFLSQAPLTIKDILKNRTLMPG